MRPRSHEKREPRGFYALLGLLIGLSASCRVTEEAEVAVAMSREGLQGAVLAMQDIRESRGIDGQAVRIELLPDSSGAPTHRAMAIADSLAANPRIVALVGHSNSASSLTAAPVYNQHRLPHISPTSTATMFSDAGPYSFRLVPGDDRQAEFLARQAARLGPSVRPAILFVNDDYGRGLNELLEKELSRSQITPVYDAPFLGNQDTTHFARLAAAVSDAAPDLLFWLGRSSQLGIFLPLLRSRLPDLLVIGSDGVEAGRVYENSGGSFDGLRFVRFVDPEAQDGRVVEVRAQFRHIAHHELTSLGLLTYDAVGLLAEALRSGARTREGVRDFLVSLGRTRPPYDGAAGPIQFEENGDARRFHLLAEVTPAGVRAVQTEGS